MNSTLVSSTQAVTTPGTTKKDAKKSQSELNTQDFLKLLSVQLANQNPLEPMKDSEYYAQIAQLGTTQGIDRLNKQADVQQAQSLMGKTVIAVRPNAVNDITKSPTVTGVVTRMVSKEGVYKVAITEANGNVVEVGLDAIQTIEPSQNLSDFANLMGKKVTGLVSNGSTVSGEVIGLAKQSGKIVLQVKGADGKTVVLGPSDLIKVE